MALLKRIFTSFSGRIVLTYTLLLALSCFMIYHLALANTAETALREIVSAQTEAAYADRQYLQHLFEAVEARYYQVGFNESIHEVLDRSADSERSVMYQYVAQIADLISSAKSDMDVIDDLFIYSDNEIAADILPGWRLRDELDTSPFPRSYAENPTRALYRHFWCATPQADSSLRLTYYAALMDASYLRMDGIIAIACNDSLLDCVMDDLGEDEAIYLYVDDRLVYTRNAVPGSDALVEARRSELKDDIAVVRLNDPDDKEQLTARFIRLPRQNLLICHVAPSPIEFALPASFWVFLLALLALASAVMILVLFPPMMNVIALARHMQGVSAMPLAPYMRKSHTYEIKTIITEYNAMIGRVNELSQTLNQKELMLRGAQIERLQSQLNPHFFYGTLESIRMIAEINGQETIAEIAYAFANMMHYSLSRDFFVPLTQEIDIVNQYVAIQRKRLGERFTFEWTTHVAVEAWRCPKFILFSLVENAFTHDVSHSRRPVGIQVSLSEEDDWLEIIVRNDGPGIEPERLRQLRRLMAHPEERQSFTSAHNGRSIFNIHDRLYFYYGDDYDFDIDSQPGRFTQCTVRIKRGANVREWEEETDDHPAH